MAETGIVINTHDHMVDIEMQRHDACAKCGACIRFSNEDTMRLTAKNDCNAQIGDRVEISLESTRFLSAVGYLYGIPLITFMLAVFAGYALHASEAVTVLIAFAVLAFTWLLIHFHTKKINQNRYLPRAVRIVYEEEK